MRQSNDDTSSSDQPAPAGPLKRPWVTPAVRELPKLTDLTLQTDGIPGGGGTGGGGSTVF
jgi:hypothetical protein